MPLVNVFLASIKRGPGKHSIYDDVDEISLRFSAHFERENQLMIESRYPDLEPHLAEHRALLSDLGKLLRAVEEATDDEMISTTKSIEDWFLKHIAGSDKKLGTFLHERAAKAVN